MEGDRQPSDDGKGVGYRSMATPKKPTTDSDDSDELLAATAPLAASSKSSEDTSGKNDYRVVPFPQRLPSEPFSSSNVEGFCSNVVITSKYTLWNFLPLFLIESFRKLANAYFLLVSALQTIKVISNTKGIPSTLPALLFILAVDGILAIIEDRRRHQADDEANSTECHVLTATFSGAATAKMTPTQDPEVSAIAWADLTVGTVVKLRNRETAPADLLILAVNEIEPNDPSGICYVETKSLDGETNLKLRHACDATLHTQRAAQVATLAGYLRCENPNKAIGRFDGILTLSAASANQPKHSQLHHQSTVASEIIQQPVAMKNVILRGCQLRNTDWVYGLVVNTGADTKIMQSSVASRPKWSSINESVNKMIIYLFLFLLLLCMVAASVHLVWMHANESDQVYLGLNRTYVLQWFVTVGQYLLLMYQMIPVSLYVTMSVVMLLQAVFIAWDVELYYAPLDARMIVRSMGLNEELGQISYVFSDKTGTLTCNVMEFRKCSINGTSYGTGMTEIGKATLRRKGIFVPEDDEDAVITTSRKPKMPYVNFEDDQLEKALESANSSPHTEAEFFLHLSLCHTVIPEVVDCSDEVRFSASSPDEQALVSAAKYFGFSFESRGLGVARVRVFNKSLMVDKTLSSELQEYRVLDVLEFTSDRKRMSVVVQNPRGELWLLTKGADNMIYPLLSKSANSPELLEMTMAHLESFADDALRTLTVAHRRLDQHAYATWSQRFKDANASLEEIEKRKRDQPNRIDALMNEIEQELVLLGATAIEDKLQDHVPRAIARLMQAGMKVWMLTGDKQETAINIAFACSLMDNDMTQLVLNCELFPTVEKVRAYLEEVNTSTARGATQEYKVRQAVVIDGECLEVTLLDDRCREEFLKLAMQCEGVVCCRVSPSQKAEIVTLVRQTDPAARTLAIGDGANDVAMIQRAHVGVGISGMEGMQAVNASDYAIAQFYFLEKLLLHHGRLNYRRMAVLVGYMFYKNIFLALAQYYFMLSVGASGQKFYSEFSFQLYNLVYTALPIGVLGVLDYDMPWDVSRNFPQLYLVGPRKELFNRYTFFKWLCSAVYEAAIVALVVLLGFQDQRHSTGNAPLLQYGVLAFTSVVLVANLKVVMWQMSWSFFSVASVLFGVLMYLPGTLLLTSSLATLSPTDYGAFQNTLNQPAYWLVAPMCVVLCLLRHYSWAAIQRRFRPQPWQIVQEAYVLNKGSKAPMPRGSSMPGNVEAGKLLYDEPMDYVSMAGTSPSPARLSEGGGLRNSRLSSSSGFAFSYDQQTSLAEARIARHSVASATSEISDIGPRNTRQSRVDSDM
ncbi:hypothetical protein Gpo141_00004113 [Globisporangium polare]